MIIKNLGAGLLAAMTLSTMIITPLAANAQRGWDKDWQERRDDNRNRNDWRDNDRNWRDRQNNDRNWRDRQNNDRDWNNRRGNTRDWNDRRDNDWRDNDRNNRDRNNRDWDRNDRDDWRDNRSDRRQDMKNEWRNIAIGAGLVGVLGLLNRDNRLVFAGGAGALYSIYRYEQDRRSQNQLDKARALYFSQPYFYRDGTRYERQIVVRNGERCYQFARR